MIMPCRPKNSGGALFILHSTDNRQLSYLKAKGLIMKLKATIAVIIGFLLPAAAFAMDADTFYRKASALQRQGPQAVLSQDLQPIMSEIKLAGQAVKAENDKAKAAGKPLYCVPKTAKMTAEEGLKALGTIPSARRKQLTVRQAWRETLIKRYPC